ncbi:unnamed protein product [Rotaria magnacalcarata]|nr:unnamed protein product [Rotaria magnacalcarata]
MPVIKKLYLSNNQIGDEGAKIIASFLQSNTTLTMITLDQNEIGSDGEHFLIDAFINNTVLLWYFTYIKFLY